MLVIWISILSGLVGFSCVSVFMFWHRLSALEEKLRYYKTWVEQSFNQRVRRVVLEYDKMTDVYLEVLDLVDKDTTVNISHNAQEFEVTVVEETDNVNFPKVTHIPYRNKECELAKLKLKKLEHT